MIKRHITLKRTARMVFAVKATPLEFGSRTEKRGMINSLSFSFLIRHSLQEVFNLVNCKGVSQVKLHVLGVNLREKKCIRDHRTLPLKWT